MSNIHKNNSSIALIPPPLHRRLIAMFYDFAITSTSILIITALIIVVVSPNDTIDPASPLANLLTTLQFLLGALYFIIFWVKKDYTLGMSVWKLRITNITGHKITLTQAIIRYISIIAVMVLGFVIGYNILHLGSGSSLLIALLFLSLNLAWSLFNPHKLTLHEQLSKTRLIDIREEQQTAGKETATNQGHTSS